MSAHPLRRVGIVRCWLTLCIGASPAYVNADLADHQSTAEGLVRARLLAENTSLQRGSSGSLAVELRMKSGWHTYWRNSGDAGLATSVKWTLPKGAAAGPLVWPWPERFVARSIVGYGYNERVALLTQVKLPSRFAADTIKIAATVSWLACADTCIPGSETLKLTLPVSDATPKTNTSAARLFADARQRIPKPAPFSATFSLNRDEIGLTFPKAAFSPAGELDAMFYPFDSSLIEHGAPQTVSQDQQSVRLILRRSPISTGELATIDGLLIVHPVGAGSAKPNVFEVSARRASTSQDVAPVR